MKKKIFYILCILLIPAMAACGGEATPTMSAADIQNTAIANAWLAITQTQAAFPTVTSTPVPTLTPLPTPTFIIVPTLSLLPVPTSQFTQPLPQVATLSPAGNPTSDPCNAPPPQKPTGTLVQAELVNRSGGAVTSLSLGMFAPNKEGECGTYGYYVARSSTQIITVLAGCYWGYAYIDTPSIAKTTNAICLSDTTKTVPIWITSDLIYLH